MNAPSPDYLESLHPGWNLNAGVCPCDPQLVRWLDDKPEVGRIMHMGTGNHHHVGSARKAQVMGITTSVEEHEAYVQLIGADPSLAESYQVLFTDLYALPSALLPEFDLITLFHLGEHHPREYGPKAEYELLCRLSERVGPFGQFAFYTGSLAWNWAWLQEQIDRWTRVTGFQPCETYQSLQFYCR